MIYHISTGKGQRERTLPKLDIEHFAGAFLSYCKYKVNEDSQIHTVSKFGFRIAPHDKS
jgi:hypothetical protein